jgi:hypothetical protein
MTPPTTPPIDIAARTGRNPVHARSVFSARRKREDR